MATSIQFCVLKRFTYAPKPEQAFLYKSHEHLLEGAEEDEQEKVVTHMEARFNYSSYPDPQQVLHPAIYFNEVRQLQNGSLSRVAYMHDNHNTNNSKCVPFLHQLI